MPCLTELRDTVLGVMQRHGCGGCEGQGGGHVVAHSFGTTVAAAILRVGVCVRVRACMQNCM